jgi:hypothetical protein
VFGRRKNIAILLFWIFTFPIVFQSVHIVWHHSHAHADNHILCNEHTTAQAFHYKYSIDSQNDNPCSICDYHFSINDIPKTSIIRSVLPLIQGIFNELEIHFLFQEIFSLKSPRAPPAH